MKLTLIISPETPNPKSRPFKIETTPAAVRLLLESVEGATSDLGWLLFLDVLKRSKISYPLN